MYCYLQYSILPPVELLSHKTPLFPPFGSLQWLYIESVDPVSVWSFSETSQNVIIDLKKVQNLIFINNLKKTSIITKITVSKPRNRKTKGFLTFSGGTETCLRTKMGKLFPV